MKTLAILLLLTIQARAEHIACEQIREHIARYGKMATYAKAVAKGMTREEISRIRKQCGI